MVKKSAVVLFIGLIMVVILFSANSAASESVVITIPEQVKTSDHRIFLGKIAEIQGVTGSKLKHYQKTDLGRSPLPGYNKVLYKRLVNLKLEEQGFSESDYILKMPGQVKVSLQTQIVSKKEILTFIKNTLKDRLNYKQENLKLTPVFCPENIKIPDHKYRFKLDNLVSDTNFIGNISLPIQIIIEDNVWKKIYVGLKVHVFQNVFIAQNNIISNQKLEREDFKKEKKLLKTDINNLIKSWNQIEMRQQVLKIPIGKGEILTTSYLKTGLTQTGNSSDKNQQVTNSQNNSIKWGSKVKAEVIIGNIVVSAKVKSKESGSKGDFILVENINTGHEFKAEVVNSRLVRKKMGF